MFLAVVFGVVSVLLGTLLGLWPSARARWLMPVRALAIGAGLAVVFAALLPEALGAHGNAALAPFAAGLAAPMLLERVLGHPPHPGEVGGRRVAFLGLELSYVGLLVHQLGDGLTMGAFAGPEHADHPHFDVFLAVAGHTVPVTAAVALAFFEHRGVRSAVIRSASLIVPSLVGLALTRVPTAERAIGLHHGWISAAAAGLLLHVVLHGSHALRPHGDHAHGGHAHGDHAHGDHAHGDHAHGDHAHGDHAHGGHAHNDHAHDDHAHGDHAHGDHAHGAGAAGTPEPVPAAPGLRGRLSELVALVVGGAFVLLLLPRGHAAHAHAHADAPSEQLAALSVAALIVAALHFTLRREPARAPCATGTCEVPPARR